MIREGASLSECEKVWKPDFDRFLKYRDSFLIYD